MRLARGLAAREDVAGTCKPSRPSQRCTGCEGRAHGGPDAEDQEEGAAGLEGRGQVAGSWPQSWRVCYR